MYSKKYDIIHTEIIIFLDFKRYIYNTCMGNTTYQCNGNYGSLFGEGWK